MTRFVHIASLAALSLAIAIAITLLASDPTHAQDGNNDYVDVALTLEVPHTIHGGITHDLEIVVVNNGTRTAYDVEVVVDVVDPNTHSHVNAGSVQVPIGTAFQDGTTFRWTIPELGGLQRLEVTPQAKLAAFTTTAPVATIFNNSLIPHEFFGRVTTSSFESKLRKENNTSRVWSYNYRTLQDGSNYPAGGNYTVAVLVEDFLPSPGDVVDFKITAARAENVFSGGQSTPPIDLKVDIELTDGLSISGDHTFTSGRLDSSEEPSQLSYDKGVFYIGTLETGQPTINSVTLPVMVASDAVVNEQCLTATLTGKPPPGTGPIDDDISDNVAKVCLGDQPVKPFVSGQVDAFTIYPCVDITTAPCDSTDDVRVRTVDRTITPERILKAGQATINIGDAPSRTYDGQIHNSLLQSVNSGGEVSWQTATAPDADFVGTRKGVKIGFTRAPFNDYLTSWDTIVMKITVDGVDGDPPGTVHARISSNGRIMGNGGLALNSGNSWAGSAGPFNLRSPQTATANWFLEFEKLGLYQMEFSAELSHATETGDCDTDGDNANDAFCASETYTFYVGPIADLTVEDGSTSSHVADNQHALAVVAVNNGPNRSPSARITGLPTNAQVLYKSPDDSSYDASTGVWNIGELRVRGYYQSAAVPEPTLVLRAAEGETADVSIASTKNYDVCVGPKDNPVNLPHTTQSACEDVPNASWNSTPVYDQDTDNNTATITAARGTGGGGPGAPTLNPPASHDYAVDIDWDEVQFLYGAPIKHYDAQWSADGTSDWHTLKSEIPHTQHMDTGVTSSERRFYRVRAVNQADTPGPWSRPIQVGTVVEASVPELRAEAISSTEIRLTWTKPGGLNSPITRYELEVADSSSVGWSPVPDRIGPSARTYIYSPHGLTGGTPKRFRIRALTQDGDHSGWSRVVRVTTKRASAPGAPRSVSAQAQGADAILVSWNAPSSDGGSPITQYQVQWHDGDSNWRTPQNTEGGHNFSLQHLRLDAGETHYYRVRAHNTSGWGPWSGAASARTRTDVPDAPILKVESATSTGTRLTWEQYFPNKDASNVYRYELQYNLDGEEWKDSWIQMARPGSRDREYRDESVQVGQRVWYRIRAVASNGNSSWSNVVSAKTPAGPPGQPANVQAAADGSNAIKLTWSEPYRTGGSQVWGYQIRTSKDPGSGSWNGLTLDRWYCKDDNSDGVADDYDPEGVDCVYHHGSHPPVFPNRDPDATVERPRTLNAGDTWHYRVRATNRVGWGPWSDWVSATVAE